MFGLMDKIVLGLCVTYLTIAFVLPISKNMLRQAKERALKKASSAPQEETTYLYTSPDYGGDFDKYISRRDIPLDSDKDGIADDLDKEPFDPNKY